MNEDQHNRAMLKRLRGTKCKHTCTIHTGEKCQVVVKYKDKKMQATIDRMNAVIGAPKHTAGSAHYCEICQLAIRENRPIESFQRNEEGKIKLVIAGKARLVDVNNDGVLHDQTFEEE